MPIVPDKSGNNPGNPVTNGWSGVDQHNKTIDEMQRDYYAAGGTTDFTAEFLTLNSASEARLYLETNNAANITTGVFDPARIPVINTTVQIISASATIAGLSPEEQAQVVRGCILTTTEGSRWVYVGGPKTSEASYILLADITPDWSVISNKPVLSNSSPQDMTTGIAGAAGVSPDLSRADHQHRFPFALINAQTGTTYTLQASDHGKVVELSNAAAITLTLPNSLPAGFNCSICQMGAGQVSLVAASGAIVRQSMGYTKVRTQYCEVAIRVRANSDGSKAEYVISGDMI